MQSDYIEHMQKGGQKKVHKYLSRYYKNGKWFYRYKVTGQGYKEDYAKNKLKSEQYAETAKSAQGQANGTEERVLPYKNPQSVADEYAKGASYYGRKAAEAEAGYKNSVKGKTDSVIAKGQAKIDKILHPVEKVTITSNLMSAGTKKTVKKKQ